MEQLDRKDARLLSELVNLRLEDKPNQSDDPSTSEGKRKVKKIGALRAIYDSQIYENFVEIVQKKTNHDKNLIVKSLKNHFTFSSLMEDKETKQMLLTKFKLCKVNQGQYLMKQGSNASCFFLLHDGRLALEIDGKVKKHLQPGQGLGELALLYSAPRSASVKAEKTSYLWFIDRQTFRTAMSTMITKNYKQNRAFIEKNPFFKYLTNEQKDKLASIAISQRFEKNTDICKQGELAASMFILKSGRLGRYKNQEFKGNLLKGQSFEEYTTLSKGSLRRETIKVLQTSDVMALGVEDIQSALGRNLPLIILRNEAKSALHSAKVFDKLSEEFIDKIIDCFRLKKVVPGEAVVKRDDSCRKMIFFVAEGNYSISEAGRRAQLYGQTAFDSPNARYSFQIKMRQNGKVAWTSLEDILMAFGCSFQEAEQKSEALNEALAVEKSKRSDLHSICKNLELKDYLVLKKLGQGQFGNVLLVTDPSKKHAFAMKVIGKEEILRDKLQKHVQWEKEAMEAIASPFVMEFIRSYKDEHNIYFLTEFINGMELFDAIRVIGMLDAHQCMLYGAQLLHIIESMHEQGIIYRDLKPENVMVCKDGYLKLIDLGTCKQLRSNEKTFTMIGTPNYMAPETLSGKGYSFSADLWSLGVVLYEFMAGFVPYGEDAENPLQIYQQMMSKSLTFPKHMSCPQMNALIQILLNRNPDARLSGGSFATLKNHPFFSKIQWHELLSKKVQAKFKVPQNSLIRWEDLKIGAKSFYSSVKAPKIKSKTVRKELSENWDATF